MFSMHHTFVITCNDQNIYLFTYMYASNLGSILVLTCPCVGVLMRLRVSLLPFKMQ